MSSFPLIIFTDAELVQAGLQELACELRHAVPSLAQVR